MSSLWLSFMSVQICFLFHLYMYKICGYNKGHLTIKRNLKFMSARRSSSCIRLYNYMVCLRFITLGSGFLEVAKRHGSKSHWTLKNFTQIKAYKKYILVLDFMLIFYAYFWVVWLDFVCFALVTLSTVLVILLFLECNGVLVIKLRSYFIILIWPVVQHFVSFWPDWLKALSTWGTACYDYLSRPNETVDINKLWCL